MENHARINKIGTAERYGGVFGQTRHWARRGKKDTFSGSVQSLQTHNREQGTNDNRQGATRR